MEAGGARTHPLPDETQDFRRDGPVSSLLPDALANELQLRSTILHLYRNGCSISRFCRRIPRPRPAESLPEGSGWRSARGEPSLAGMFALGANDQTGAVLAQAAGVSGSGISGRGRLYGSRQLGDLARRRFPVRLRAADGRAVVQRDGDRAAVAVHAARRRRRARPRPGLPQFLSAMGVAAAVAVGGNRHHRYRSGRGDRHRDRPQSAVSHSASRSA